MLAQQTSNHFDSIKTKTAPLTQAGRQRSGKSKATPSPGWSERIERCLNWHDYRISHAPTDARHICAWNCKTCFQAQGGWNSIHAHRKSLTIERPSHKVSRAHHPQISTRRSWGLLSALQSRILPSFFHKVRKGAREGWGTCNRLVTRPWAHSKTFQTASGANCQKQRPTR